MIRRQILMLLCATFFLHQISSAQYLRASAGTDVPLQYFFGINYQQGKYASAEMSLGYVGIPYNGDLYRVIKVPERHQARKEFLMETTDDGFVWATGLNGHYKKWYGGIFAQRIELHASASYEYILGSELFQEELSQENRNLLNTFLNKDLNLGGLANVDLDQSMRLTTLAWQVGLKIGRRFSFKNPRWEFRAELAYSKNIKAVTNSDYDEGLFTTIKQQYNILKNDQSLIDFIEQEYGFKVPTDVNLDDLFDFEAKEDDIDQWFHDYAYIPTLNFHVTYLLFIPKKLRALNPAQTAPAGN